MLLGSKFKTKGEVFLHTVYSYILRILSARLYLGLNFKFPLSSKSNGSTKLFSSPMTDIRPLFSKLIFFFATELPLHFHLVERYAACQASLQKAVLLCSDLDPSDLHCYRTAGFELTQLFSFEYSLLLYYS